MQFPKDGVLVIIVTCCRTSDTHLEQIMKQRYEGRPEGSQLLLQPAADLREGRKRGSPAVTLKHDQVESGCWS